MKDAASNIFDSLNQIEQTIFPFDYPAGNASWFDTVEGVCPVLFSAPHACRHLRDDSEKMNEEYTAAMAVYAARMTDSHAIYTTRKSIEDPNWVAAGEYKSEISRLVRERDIRLVIDVHGMTNRHQMGVALGTMAGRSMPGVDVTSPFVDSGFLPVAAEDVGDPLPMIPGKPLAAGAGAEKYWNTVVVDHPRFTGGLRHHTVTRYAVEVLGLSALQVELASVNRIVHRAATEGWPFDYRGNPAGIVASTNALMALPGLI